MKDPLDVSPSKENQGTMQGKEKIHLTSVGIKSTTSGLDLPLPLCIHAYRLIDLNLTLNFVLARQHLTETCFEHYERIHLASEICM